MAPSAATLPHARTSKGCCLVGHGRHMLRALALAIPMALAEPCPGRPQEAVIQFTEESCSPCCFDLDDFIEAPEHEYVYVLFYKTTTRLNVNLLTKFEQIAKEWRWSRIYFGKADTDRDRPMSEKWMNPQMTPTNIMFRNGKGVSVDLKDFEVMKRKYDAGPEGQKWWLTKYLGDDKEGTNLHYAIPVQTAKGLRRFLKRNSVAFVGFFEKATSLAWDAFHEFVWRASQVVDATASDGVITTLKAMNASFAAVPQLAFAPGGSASVVLYRNGTQSASLSLKALGRQPAMDALVNWVKDLQIQHGLPKRKEL